jgi:hypothetical protein
MKRVRVIAAAVPAALGMAFPAAANATAVTHPPAGGSQQVHPDDASFCISPGRIGDCFSVRGGESNTINNMRMYNWSKAGHAYVGYRDVPGSPAKSKWRNNAMFFASRGWRYSWGPGCSFPTGTHVYGWTSYRKPDKSISFDIHGSTFTGKHKCA